MGISLSVSFAIAKDALQRLKLKYSGCFVLSKLSFFEKLRFILIQE
ncbi:hypothetical protein P296_21940 [Salmonella enterica subsp. arizonae serovar 18:z4,z23:- str. CVM N26624]|uniref:Uncharacterized protein n=2 Tax=Salmonella enterica subsp. arizonae TaxID=59203 RepID=A9MK13_SALAR|nr:hypothetical protein SARI_00649 [Salmonella enterica subsp. arizonae serovar 62:z4,z23:-]AIP97209.1 hypothetical protein N898_03005 [Salmonella enterica subsp. arizonae serovar 62:z36:- str. RKS2983]OLV93175.1 hypothetical protein P298_22510 [Salmonella enterica subsp. arizonae serovar 18:z4,z23:- str. CVM N26626]OLV93188.1 hypothetical protein P296_21940 [Salmonella enterica subsp. arizonae serovar 18:z4,z23:- str. CVM N26624]OLV93228.1 hypothetical protein P297_22330 [Salmonella enterica s